MGYDMGDGDIQISARPVRLCLDLNITIAHVINHGWVKLI